MTEPQQGTGDPSNFDIHIFADQKRPRHVPMGPPERARIGWLILHQRHDLHSRPRVLKTLNSLFISKALDTTSGQRKAFPLGPSKVFCLFLNDGSATSTTVDSPPLHPFLTRQEGDFHGVDGPVEITSPHDPAPASVDFVAAALRAGIF